MRAALLKKVSRERVGTELEGMFNGEVLHLQKFTQRWARHAAYIYMWHIEAHCHHSLSVPSLMHSMRSVVPFRWLLLHIAAACYVPDLICSLHLEPFIGEI